MLSYNSWKSGCAKVKGGESRDGTGGESRDGTGGESNEGLGTESEPVGEQGDKGCPWSGGNA